MAHLYKVGQEIDELRSYISLTTKKEQSQIFTISDYSCIFFKIRQSMFSIADNIISVESAWQKSSQRVEKVETKKEGVARVTP